ncbi:MAG: hypothetical protein Q4A72_06650 [Bacillota bacterium]|nr:hypothetical protein [Bacillota bacterium]
MANYVYHKVICSKETLEQYFIDEDPSGESVVLEQPYLSFHKLFGVKGFGEYEEKVACTRIDYAFGFGYYEREDGLYEMKFRSRWFYPIKAIMKALELSHDLVWYAVEENHIYISKFYWDGGVKEDVLYIEYEYDSWSGENPDFFEGLEDWDGDVWYFLPTVKQEWKHWESTNGFQRYFGDQAVPDPFPFER